MTQIGAMSEIRGSAAATCVPRRNVLRSFAFADLLALSLCALVSLLADSFLAGGGALGTHMIASGGLGLLAVLWFRSAGHYRARHALANQVRPILQASGLAFLSASTIHATMNEADLQTVTLVFWACAPVLLLSLRMMTKTMLIAAGDWLEPVTLLSPATVAWDRAHVLGRNHDHGLTVEQTIDLSSFAELDPPALSRRLDQLADATIFLAPDAQTQGIANRIVARLSARGAAYYYQPCMGPAPTQNIDILDYPPAEGFVFQIADSLDRPLAQWIKRSFDVTVCAVSLFLLAPFFLLVAWLIRRDGGPALFEQARVGKDGQVFGCLKFRTMRVDAEAELARMLATDPVRAAEWNTYQKLSDDPRITRVGRILRAASLDELPQLINVLRGEMSLVGPRPMTVEQQVAYGASLESYVRMRPGLTGMWQVNGRNSTSFEERARLDDWYARNWSLWRDVVILVRTVREVLFSTGQ